MFKEATEAVATANYRSPKTVLGFFAILVGILVSAAVVVVGILARVSALQHLIIPILLFAAAVLLVVLVGVFITAWKDPTILMLGQVSGEVYIENRKLTLGDSTSGEFTELVTESRSLIDDRALPPSSEGAAND